MLKRLISLAVLLSFVCIEFSYSSDKVFIIPKEKPSVFKNLIQKSNKSKVIESQNTNKNNKRDNVTIPQNKPINQDLKSVLKKKKDQVDNNKIAINFIYPKKNQPCIKKWLIHRKSQSI